MIITILFDFEDDPFKSPDYLYCFLIFSFHVLVISATQRSVIIPMLQPSTIFVVLLPPT